MKILSVVVREGQRGNAGSELKRLLAKLGIHERATCKCKSRMLMMDRNGNAWCRANVPLIVGWLEEEARERKMLFSRLGATAIVRLAIHYAMRNEKRGKKVIL